MSLCTSVTILYGLKQNRHYVKRALNEDKIQQIEGALNKYNLKA